MVSDKQMEDPEFGEMSSNESAFLANMKTPGRPGCVSLVNKAKIMKAKRKFALKTKEDERKVREKTPRTAVVVLEGEQEKIRLHCMLLLQALIETIHLLKRYH